MRFQRNALSRVVPRRDNGPMRIVHVANFYGPGSGGLTTALEAIGKGYRRAGHEFTVIMPGRRNSRVETPAGLRITLAIFQRGQPRRSLVPVKFLIERTLTELAPDRLEVSDRLSLRHLGHWAHRNDVPTVMIAHERTKKWVFARATSNLPLTREPRVEADSDSTLQHYQNIVCTTLASFELFERMLPERAHHIPWGVDLQEFSPLKWSANTRRAHLRSHDVLLVHAGRLSRDKAPERSISALRELRRRGVDACLVIAGSGPSVGQLRRLAGDMPVEFVGFIADRARLATLLASADVMLCPGPTDTFGISALESLACGTPVVAASTSDLSELLTPGAGVVAAPTGLAFADAVQELLALRTEDRRTAARHRATSHPWDATTRSLLEIHTAAAGARARGTSPHAKFLQGVDTF